MRPKAKYATGQLLRRSKRRNTATYTVYAHVRKFRFVVKFRMWTRHINKFMQQLYGCRKPSARPCWYNIIIIITCQPLQYFTIIISCYLWNEYIHTRLTNINDFFLFFWTIVLELGCPTFDCCPYNDDRPLAKIYFLFFDYFWIPQRVRKRFLKT